MKRPIVVHPFLFAVFPILSLFAHNVNKLTFSEILVPTAIALGFALLLLLLSDLILKDRAKAGMIVSTFLILSSAYGPFFDATQGWLQVGRSSIDLLLLFTWGTFLVCFAYLTIKTQIDLRNLTSIANVIAVFLVVIPAISMISHLRARAAWRNIESTKNIAPNPTNLRQANTLPDIYYIILDRYASASTLRDVYGYDNSEFVDYLCDRGFYVASESRSNYLKTAHSLAASLNMEYVNYLGSTVGEESDDWLPLYSMLQDYEVWRFLKSRGYEFIHFGSWWDPTRKNKHADMNFNLHSLPQFSKLVIRRSAIYPIARKLGFLDARLEQWERVRYKFDKLAEMPNIKEPTFVFAHMLIPHTPYVFDRDGDFLTEEEVSRRSRTDNYVDQLVFTNEKVKQLVDSLLSNSEVPPIIILQSDEGPFPTRYAQDTQDFDWRQASESELRQKMGILNAYYLPGVDRSSLYSSITPVNSFRMILNLYFDTGLELLPDKSYAFIDQRHIYRFIDVTDIVS